MKKLINIPIFLLALVFTNGCMDSESELKSELLAGNAPEEGAQVTSGSADFSNFVAVGASYTAGYMDGAVYNAGQANSFPAIIANQMLAAGGGDFAQPDINSADGYNTVASDPANDIILGRFVLDAGAGAPTPIGPGDIASILTPYDGDLNNFGVPGARVVDLVSDLYGTPDVNGDGIPEGNPFYVRIASNPIGPGGSTVIGDAAAAEGTFFILDIGGNDALGWALSGGTAPDVADDPAAIANTSALTDATNFGGALAATVAALRAGGAKGVIPNIPDVTFLPFFSLIPHLAIPLTDADQVAQLNAGFAGYNAALDGLVGSPFLPTQADADLRKVSYSLGANPILIADDDLVDLTAGFDFLLGLGAITTEQRAALAPLVQARPIQAGELTLITAQTLLGAEIDGNPLAVRGVSVPLEDQYTLTSDELTVLRARIDTFNDLIEAQAVAGEVGIVDLETFASNAAAAGGITVDGVTLGLSITPNDIFSTDFIHPNPRGYAGLANEYIKAINSEFGATLKEVDVLDFPGVSLL